MMDLDDDLMDTQTTEFTETQTEKEPPVLVFPESLIGTPKPYRVGELISLLTILRLQLKEFDQNGDTSSLGTVAKELIHKQVINNTNKTVKALAACCIADIIRLHAPTCPYNAKELKAVFTFFVEQLSYFGTETNDFEHYFYLLENLQSVKTFLLLGEIEDSEAIVHSIVENFFTATAKGNLSRAVELCMTDVLIQLIEDVGLSDPESVKIILDQFEEHDKGSENPAYLMAIDICFACPSILQRKVCQYFSEVLLTVGGNIDSESDEFKDVEKAHHLILKINAVAPDLLLNVLPLLQEEMKLDQLNVRQLATETMGKMFAEPSSTVAEKYQSIWKTWLGRRDDKVLQLRIKWLEMCVDICKNHHERVPELIQWIRTRLCDPEDKVRLTACKVLREVGMENDLKNLDRPLLLSIAERIKDKKVAVRREAMYTIGSIYQNCYEKVEAGDTTVINKVGWIPGELFNCLYVGDPSVTTSMEHIINNHILPENENDAERAGRLVTIVASLDEKQKLAFTALMRKQQSTNENIHRFVTLCQDLINNVNQSEHDVATADEFMKYIAAFFPDKGRTLNALRSFRERENERDVKLLKTAIDLNKTYKQVVAAKKKLLSNLNDDQVAIAEIFTAILERSCPLILSRSVVPHLFLVSKERTGRRVASTPRALAARYILKEVSVTYPSMYSTYTKNIIEDIMNDNDNSGDESLELLSEISKSSRNRLNYDADLKQRLISYVTDGSVAQAEFAATALSNMRNASTQFADLVSNISDELLLNTSNLLNNLTSLAQFALYSSELITPSIDSIIRFVESDLLPARTKQFASKNPEWETYENLPKLSQQKLVGVRILVNYLSACKEKPEPEEYIINQIFSIFWNLLDKTCDGAIADGTNAAETSHLRLAASQSIVTLTNNARYMNELTVTKFERLSVSLQDTCYYVRLSFAESLIKGLQSEQIHSRYYTLLFVCAHEIEETLLKKVKAFIQQRFKTIEVKQNESSVLDSSLVRLIHLLAHHPDFSIAADDLNVSAQYLRFFLSCVATADNVSFLYHILQKIKLSKDMVSNELSQNSYVLCDLACLLINNKCKEASWPLAAYEGQITLHSKLYRSLPPGAIQTETIKTSYLPNDYIKLLNEEQNHKSGDKRSRSHAAVGSKRIKV